MFLYAALDAEVPIKLCEPLTAALKEAKLEKIADLENAALPCVAWGAVHGVPLDKVAWESLAAESTASQERLNEALDQLAPSASTLTASTNWNSPEQVQQAFKAVGITLTSTDDDALAAVDHPLAKAVRDYRSAAKLVGTYGLDWLKHAAPDSRVYPSWNQIGASSSGRMSCSKPNMQQLPRDLRYRRCFAAPPGRILVKADYSQIELRIAAKLTGERRMLEAYQKGEDLHTLTAAALLDKPRSTVTKADRQLAKAINFGLLYGQGAKGLVAYALSSYGVQLTLDQATAHREAFFRTYPGLRAWHRGIGATNKRAIETRTLTGRRRLDVMRFTEKANTPVQGTGADGLKRALALLWERRDRCPEAFPVLFVHDEIVVECAEDQKSQATDWIRDAMRDGMKPIIDPVPVEVEVSIGRTWGG
jgi:DNA polymerase-1